MTICLLQSETFISSCGGPSALKQSLNEEGTDEETDNTSSTSEDTADNGSDHGVAHGRGAVHCRGRCHDRNPLREWKKRNQLLCFNYRLTLRPQAHF